LEASNLAESAVNSLAAKRMVKNQQMRWSPSGAHLMLQVRVAVVNGNPRQRLRQKLDLPALPLHPIFPSSSGSSRHGAPVRVTQKMPSSVRR
jgi:hypothetical protein